MNAMLFRALAFAAALLLASGRPAAAQEAPGLIRDAEIESLIRDYATPLWKAAGLDAEFVQVYLVNDPHINAFVADGQRLFIHTGLLMKADRPNMVIGVIAHETGHIAGGHLVRVQEALENATAQSIIAFLIGAAGAVVTRNGAVAAAGLDAGQSFGLHTILAYSVGQEARADAAGLTFLDKTHQSARGLLDFFRMLEKEELLVPAQQDPYLRTHPLTSERIDVVAAHVAKSPWSDAKDSPELIDRHNRMLAKLRGFLMSPSQALEMYPATDKSSYARYARAAAYHRVPMEERALGEIDSLLKEKPDDPYYNELHGQILFEGGKPADAVEPYKKAVKSLPDSALMLMELSQAELEVPNNDAMNQDALKNLRQSVKLDNTSTDTWHLLGIAEGRAGNIGQAALALAEEGILAGDLKQASQQATRATELLPRGTPGWIRAEDIRTSVKNERDRS
ncbi:MAG TPA: M48 family metalloprotease [Aliidongia sp.]|nr:M48 family metalloprotease [Aliidongia sp.]